MRALLYILLVVFCVAVGANASMAAPGWEVVSTYQVEAEPSDAERIDVSVKDGYIYVATQKPVVVKVLSIVGQLISEKSIPAGVSRLRITSKGIYILKVGTLTKRVSI